MRTVALTGNVASGKSTVAQAWREAGVSVVNADDLARQAVAPGSPGLQAVVDLFGADVLDASGALDRDAMRARIVADPAARARLESVVHPIVWQLRDAFVRERRAAGDDLVVAEIPLLFETGREGDFDEVVLVHAPEEVRLARLVERRGLDEAEARALMAAQGEAEAKRARADHVLVNEGSPDQLRAAALELLAELRAAAAPGASVPVRVHTPTPDPPAPGRMRIDLHMHTWGSWDCLSDPERLLATARARGMSRIAITDHDRLHVALKMAERHPDLVIPGEEVRTEEGIDVIGLYLHEEIPRGIPAREAVTRIRRQGGIVYLPHPYARGKGGGGRYAEELAALADVVEVFNARLHPGRLNDPAPALAARHGCLPGAGSDAHTVGEVAGAFVDVPEHDNTPAGLLAALADARVHGRMSSNVVHLASTWAKVRKRLPGAPRG